MAPSSRFSLDEFYDAYPRIEEEFQAVLDTSLQPRGPELLYHLVDELRLPREATVVDVGCGEGRQALELAERFGFSVRGIDPVQRHIELVNAALASAAARRPELGSSVRFERGTAEALRVAGDSVDLVWCRDVLVHVADLHRAYAEFRRVLRRNGHILVYQMFGTDRLEPREAAWLWATAGVVPESARPERTEAAIVAAGLRVDRCVELGTEWSEWAEEHSAKSSRILLHAARLLRAPERYIGQFGQAAYDVKLGDCLWHVDIMIGKLSPRIYLLSVAS
jgi:SAM-dependent methyltransferase